MFALAIYDKLTPGALTGGKKIAGTGEIAPDGTVGPIGGVRQKMAGAAQHDAKIFLVPAANCAEAADGDDFGMKLVKITKLDDAICSLEALGQGSRGEGADVQLMPDSPLRRAALEMEAYVAADGWDQAPRLFALVATADLVSQQPDLADQLVDDAGEHHARSSRTAYRPTADSRTCSPRSPGPTAVMGCAAVLERIMLPPEAEDGAARRPRRDVHGGRRAPGPPRGTPRRRRHPRRRAPTAPYAPASPTMPSCSRAPISYPD